jgi:cytochrome c biogenesis protein CcdA
MRKHLVIHTDVVSGCITFSEAPRLAQKFGTCRSDSPIRALKSTTRGYDELAKPGLLYPLVWIPCYGIVFAGVAKKSKLLNK